MRMINEKIKMVFIVKNLADYTNLPASVWTVS